MGVRSRKGQKRRPIRAYDVFNQDFQRKKEWDNETNYKGKKWNLPVSTTTSSNKLSKSQQKFAQMLKTGKSTKHNNHKKKSHKNNGKTCLDHTKYYNNHYLLFLPK